MLEIVAFLEENQSGGGLDSPGPSASRSIQRISSFHDRLHQISGRATDESALHSDVSQPKSPSLSKAYPNPFNSIVTIQFELPEMMPVKLEVFNLMGQRVATLMDKPAPVGITALQWNAADAASGVYIYRLEAGSHVETHKLLLLK